MKSTLPSVSTSNKTGTLVGLTRSALSPLSDKCCPNSEILRPSDCSMLQNKCMIATLSARNQIVIPPEAREALDLKPGDKVLVVVRGRRVVLLRKPTSYCAAIRELAGRAYPKTYLQRERRSWD